MSGFVLGSVLYLLELFLSSFEAKLGGYKFDAFSKSSSGFTVLSTGFILGDQNAFSAFNSIDNSLYYKSKVY